MGTVSDPIRSDPSAVVAANGAADVAAIAAETDSCKSIDLCPVIDQVAAQELKRALLDMATGSKRIGVDAARVERVTTPGVQVLLAARRTLASRGSALVVERASPAFRSAFHDLGLGDELQTWEARDGQAGPDGR